MQYDWNEEVGSAFVGALAALIFGPLFLLVFAGINAIGISLLWGWYLANRFGELPTSAAFGLALIAALLFRPGGSAEPPKNGTLLLKLFMPFITPVVIIIAGWLGTFLT